MRPLSLALTVLTLLATPLSRWHKNYSPLGCHRPAHAKAQENPGHRGSGKLAHTTGI